MHQTLSSRDKVVRDFFVRGLCLSLVVVSCLFGRAHAEPVQAKSDSDVIEVLPAARGERADERRLRKQWAADPQNPEIAATLARRYLVQAREQGEPRFAGRALAVLGAWPDAERAPDDVLLMLATVQQYLHEFDTSMANLERLVRRRPAHAQAWLTLATIRRVRGLYADSDAACRAVQTAGASLYAQACLAENQSLRGEFDAARRQLDALLAGPSLPADTRNWLLTTLAELEARAGRSDAAERAYRSALAAEADDYTALSFADFLLAHDRPDEVAALLQVLPRSDVVLLRLAMAGKRSPAPQSGHDLRELRERMAQAALRPAAQTVHAREQAMFALAIEGQADRALALARINVQQQREPIDVLLLAQTARAAHDEQALRDTRRMRAEMGLKDERLDALL